MHPVKTLILLHGWGADGSVWQKQASAFAERLQVETPTIPAWDPAWLAAYLRQYHLPDCLLVGWSLGGMLLLETLAGQPTPVGGLALVGVPPVFCSQPDHPWGQPPVVVRAMRRGLKSDPRKVLQDFAGKCLGPGEEAWHQEVAGLFTANNGAQLAEGLDYLLGRDLRPLLPNLAAPGVIIQGDQDLIVDPEQTSFLHDRLPNSSLRLLPAAGHLPFWTQAGKFNDILAEIIGR